MHRPLFFAELRVIAASRRALPADRRRAACARRRRTGSSSVARACRHGLLGLYARRVQRGEGNRLPAPAAGCSPPASSPPLAAPRARLRDRSAPRAASCRSRPRRPASFARRRDRGCCAIDYGPVSIHAELRRQNTAVPGTVEQGKTSYLVATVAEDLERERCAVIVFDPKGDAADAAISLVDPLADVHAARPRPTDVRIQPARRRRARGRDRRLRRGGAPEPLHRRGHQRLLGPLSAQRGDRRARL